VGQGCQQGEAGLEAVLATMVPGGERAKEGFGNEKEKERPQPPHSLMFGARGRGRGCCSIGLGRGPLGEGVLWHHHVIAMLLCHGVAMSLRRASCLGRGTEGVTMSSPRSREEPSPSRFWSEGGVWQLGSHWRGCCIESVSSKY